MSIEVEHPGSGAIQRLEELESDNRRAVEAIDKKNKEIASLNEELGGLQAKYLESRKLVAELQNKLQQADSEKLSYKFREQNLTQEIELLKSNNSWLDEELNTKTSELSKVRREKSSQVSKLQSDLDTALSDVSSLTRTNEVLNGRVDTLSKNYDDALLKIKDLQNYSAVSEENFKKEMTAQQRLASLWERSANEARARIGELEEALAIEHEKEAQQAASWKAVAEKESERADQAEAKLAAVEIQLEEMHADQERLEEQQQQQQRSGTPSTPLPNQMGSVVLSSPLSMFSPSAHAISQVQKSGISLTQLYTDFMKAKHQLEHERLRNKSLQQNFDELISDLETRAPIIQAEREEANRLKYEIAEMSALLDETEKDKEDLEKKVDSMSVELKDGEREIKIYQQQVHDLSRQVQLLLAELQSHITGAGPLSAAEQSALRRLIADSDSQENQSDTDALISERLVTFKSIIELQQQNQNLLRVTRDLGDRLEREEAETRRKLENLESAAVDEKQKTIDQLESQLKHTQTKMDAYQRERDMFRDILAGKSGDSNGALALPAAPAVAESDEETVALEKYNELEKKYDETKATLKDLQDQYEAYRKESAVDMKMLNEQIMRVADERASIQRELSRAQTQLELTSERLKIMTDNFDMAKTEKDEIQKRNSQLQESLAKQDTRTEQVANELLELKSSLETMRTENTTLKAEKSVHTSTQQRLKQDNQELIEERTRLNNMIAYLQNVEAEKEKYDGETRRRLSNQVETLESELKVAREKLEAEMEEARKVAMLKDFKIDELQVKIDSLNGEVVATKESLTTVAANRDALQAQVVDLTQKLAASEEKAALYQRQIEEEGFSVARNLEIEVSELKASLESTRAELNGAKEQVETLTGIASAAEEALASMNTAHDQYKASIEEQLAAKNTELENLNTQVSTLSKELAQTTTELAQAQEDAVTKSREFSEERTKLLNEMQTLKDAENRATANAGLLQNDLRKQAQITRDAQKNYELELVKHAATAQELQKLRNSNTRTTNLINQLREDVQQARSALETAESSWNTRKSEYEAEITSLQSRCEKLTEQNKLLHNQFESLSSQVTRIQRQQQQSRVDGEPATPGVPATPGSATPGVPATPVRTVATTFTDESSVEDLRDIIKFLRHEKEIVDCQYDLAVQETRRLKQRLDHTSSALDEVRVQLAQERETNASAGEQTAMHQELLSKVNELNVLRESNSSLREDNRRATKRIASLEENVLALEQTISPLQEKLAMATADLEAKEQQLALVQEDNERWKARTQQILQKYERVDPVELQDLKDENSKLSAEIDSLKSLRDSAQAEVDSYKKTIEGLESELQKTKNELAEAQTESTSVKAELADAKTELTTSAQKAKEEYDSLMQRLDKIKNEAQAKLKQRRDTEKLINTELAALKVQMTSLKETLQAKEKEAEDAKAASEELQQKISTLTASDTLQQNISSLEAEVASLKETVAAKENEIESLKTESAAALASALADRPPATSGEGETVPAERLAEEQKKITDLQNSLEQAQNELTDALKLKEEGTNELERLKAELDKRQKESQSSEGDASGESKSTAQSVSSEDSEKLRLELEGKYKAELEETLKAKTAEMEAAKADAISKVRESVLKESSMRNTLLQHKAEKLEREKQEVQKQLALLQGQRPTPDSASQPTASAPLTATMAPPSTAPSGVPTSASPGLQIPQKSAGSAESPSSQLKVDAAPFVPMQSPVAQSVSSPANSAQPTAEQAPSAAKAMIGRPVLQVQGLAKAQTQQSQLPTLNRGHRVNPLNPILQHLQPRRGPALMRPNADVPPSGIKRTQIPHPPAATGGEGAESAGAASTATAQPAADTAAADAAGGVKRAREDESGAATPPSGSESTEQATFSGHPVQLKRRREETQ